MSTEQAPAAGPPGGVAPGRPRWQRWALALLVLLVLAGAVLAWRARPMTVPVLQVQPGDLVRTLQFSARVSTVSRAELGSTVTGRVERVHVLEGERVRTGQLLVVLESAQEQASLQQALASRRQAQARLTGLRASGRDGARAGQAQARAALAAAEADLRRAEQLVQQGFVSASRLDEARRGRDVAQAQLDAAEAAVQAVDESGSEIAQAQAQARLAEAAVDAARARLAQARLLAPSDGQVLSRLVEPGQIVQPGRALLVLALDGPTRIVAQVDERFLQQLAPAQAAWAVADAYPDQRIALTLVSIAPLVDAQRGAVEVKLALREAPPAFLRQDMSLSVEVETARRSGTIAVPLSALLAVDGDTARVHVVFEGRVQARTLRLGLRTQDAAEVLDGLRAGDQVLLDPAVAPDRRVRPSPVAVRFGAQARGGAAESAAAALTNAMGR